MILCCGNFFMTGNPCLAVVAVYTGGIAVFCAGSGNGGFFFGVLMTRCRNRCGAFSIAASTVITLCFTVSRSGGGNGVGFSVVCFIAGRNTAAGTVLVMSACRVDER